MKPVRPINAIFGLFLGPHRSGPFITQSGSQKFLALWKIKKSMVSSSSLQPWTGRFSWNLHWTLQNFSVCRIRNHGWERCAETEAAADCALGDLSDLSQSLCQVLILPLQPFWVLLLLITILTLITLIWVFLFLELGSPHSSVVCFTAGVLALLLLPVLAKNTYISENALMPGQYHLLAS